MASEKIIARHIFHPETSGSDRLHAWIEATKEPFFVWGTASGQEDSIWFGKVKSSFNAWLARTNSARLTIYHDGMGADALGPLDQNENKIMFLHHWVPRWQKNFEWMLRCTGKVLVGHPQYKESLRENFPWIPDKYIHCVRSPHLDLNPGGGGSGAKSRTGIWLHGRKWKRSGNRLRSIIDRWPAEAGEVEIISSGKTPSWGENKHVIWSIGLPFDFAVERIHTWDSCLLLDDFCCDSPWLLRAIELGCFPLVPEGSGYAATDEWAEESAPRQYEWGDVDSALKLLFQWRNRRTEVGEEFRNWSRRLLQAHSINNFRENWNNIKASALNAGAPRICRRKAAGSLTPVAWYERLQRLRSGT